MIGWEDSIFFIKVSEKSRIQKYIYTVIKIKLNNIFI